jgi:hypothetical protein
VRPGRRVRLLARPARVAVAQPFAKTLVFCGIRQRMMQGQHSHGVAYYRCSYPEEYALANNIDLPRNVIMREETLIRPVDTWLFQEFSPLQRRQTIASRPARPAMFLYSATV